MTDEIAVWDPGWARARRMPDGPAELWIAVFDGDGHFMGAAPGQAALHWRDGQLVLDYSPAYVVMRYGGRYTTGVICAVVPSAGTYVPMWPVSLGKPGELRPGDSMTIEGVIAISPDDDPEGWRILGG